MRSKLLIIGAGASRGARDSSDEMSCPPLGNNLCRFLLHYLDNFEERKFQGLERENGNPHKMHQGYFDRDTFHAVKKFLKYAECKYGSADNIVSYEAAILDYLNSSYSSALLGAFKTQPLKKKYWDGRNDGRLLDHLNRLIALIFSGDPYAGPAFKEGSDLYDDLILKLRIEECPSKWSVISFNYDILFEQAATRAGCFDSSSRHVKADGETNLNFIEVLKPHGSINWFPLVDQNNDGRDVFNVTLNKKIGFPARETTSSKVEPNFCELQKCLQITTSYNSPIMAHYTTEKPVLNNFNTIIKQREACVKVARDSKQTIIVGLRPPKDGESEDDPVLSEIFHNLSGQVKYVNSTCTSMDQYGFEIIQKKLSEFILVD